MAQFDNLVLRWRDINNPPNEIYTEVKLSIMNKDIIIAQIATLEYIEKFRDVDKFIEFCKKCNNYKSLWSCPPFDDDRFMSLNQFELTTIIGVKIHIDEDTRCKATNNEERNTLIRDILFGVRKEVDEVLLNLEQQTHTSRLYYAGSCRLCAPTKCSRIDNMPCRYPKKMRSTLEAVGFDMGRTTSDLLSVELKWCDGDMLPPYFTLVYGFLSNHSVIDDIKNTIVNVDNISTISEIGKSVNVLTNKYLQEI